MTNARYIGWGAGVDVKHFYDPQWEGSPTTDPLRPYGDPSYDSADPIEARRVRKVGCASPETTYSGAWKSQGDSIASFGSNKEGDSVALDFRGTGIYWRALQNPDCGEADVFLDGAFQKTVDCGGGNANYKFWFVKTGLEPRITHTIKIVVRGEHDRFAGHVDQAPEFRVCGREQSGLRWFQWPNGQERLELPVVSRGQLRQSEVRSRLQHLARRGSVGRRSELASAWECSGHRSPVECSHGRRCNPCGGEVSLEAAKSGHVEADITQNSAVAWMARDVSYGHPTVHDLHLSVSKGDKVSFRVIVNGTESGDRVRWNPVITFIEPDLTAGDLHH